MEGLRISISESGGEEISKRLQLAMEMARNPSAAAQASAEWMAGETFNIFAAAYNVDGPWKGLSKVTLFLRRHRANTPRNSDVPGSDTGRLRGSFNPDWASDGSQFGAGTNVEYAQRFNDGGPSEKNEVAIAGFKRANMKRKMKDYIMHMKAGNDIPPRQFFPKGMPELESWGYVDKVRQIFALHFKSVLGGTA